MNEVAIEALKDSIFNLETAFSKASANIKSTEQSLDDQRRNRASLLYDMNKIKDAILQLGGVNDEDSISSGSGKGEGVNDSEL